jgi:hypothetical protein
MHIDTGKTPAQVAYASSLAASAAASKAFTAVLLSPDFSEEQYRFARAEVEAAWSRAEAAKVAVEDEAEWVDPRLHRLRA